MHQRQTIVNKIVALLTGVSGVPTPKEADDLPATGIAQPIVRVAITGESSTRSKSELEDERKLRLEIRIASPRAAGFQTALNTISELVESKLGANPTLQGTADSCEYVGMSSDFGNVADIDSASLVLSYEATYIYTPTIAADTFITLSLQIDMAGPRNDPQEPAEPDGQIDASATIALPT